MKRALFILFGLLLFACPTDDEMNDTGGELQPVTYQLLNFEFMPQTDTEEESVSYEIEFFNPNEVMVTGTPLVTLRSDGFESTSQPNGDCQSIPASGSCILSYFVQDDNPELFPATPVEFVRAEYVLDE